MQWLHLNLIWVLDKSSLMEKSFLFTFVGKEEQISLILLFIYAHVRCLINVIHFAYLSSSDYEEYALKFIKFYLNLIIFSVKRSQD